MNMTDKLVLSIDDTKTSEEVIKSLDLTTNDKNVSLDILSTNIEKIEADLKYVFDFQLSMVGDENLQNNQISINIKNLPVHLKIQALEYALEYDSLIDSVMIFNIYNLIKGGGNTHNKDYFKVEEVYVNNIAEDMSIRENLHQKLNNFRHRLCVYYLSILKSCDKIEADYEDMVLIPLVFQRILNITDFHTLSVMLNMMKDVKLSETVLVNNANAFLNSLANNQVVKTQLVSLLESLNPIIKDGNNGDNSKLNDNL